MSFGLQTYNEAGQVSSTYDAQMAGVHAVFEILPINTGNISGGSFNIGDPPPIRTFTDRTDTIHLGSLSQNPAWFAATAVSASDPTYDWDMPAFYAWIEGDYLRVYSMSNAHLRIVVGRY